MRNPTNSQLRDLQNIRMQKDVMEFLEGSYEDTKELLVTMQDSESVKALQGEARVYRKLLGLIAGETQKSGKR